MSPRYYILVDGLESSSDMSLTSACINGKATAALHPGKYIDVERRGGNSGTLIVAKYHQPTKGRPMEVWIG